MIPRIATVMLAVFALGGATVRAEDLPRLVFVEGQQPAALETRLQLTASRGYRLIATAEGTDLSGRSRVAVLLERDASGAKYEYAVRSGTGDLSDASMRRTIDPLFGQGYRFSSVGFVVRRWPEIWLPESAYDDQATLILERDADSDMQWSYASLGFGTETTFYRALDDHRRQGFEILGLWNTDRKLQLILQRPADRDRPAASYTSDQDYRLLLIATRTVLKSRLNSMSKQGYRVREAEDPPTVGPPMLLVQRSAEAGKALKYRFFKSVRKRMRNDRFAEKLNKRALNGWRLTPGGLTDSAYVLQRNPKWKKGQPSASYRLLSSSNAAELASDIAGAMEDGCTLVTMVVEPSRTSVLLEKFNAQ